MTAPITGTGIFTWDGSERRSDRYGSFTLDNVNYNQDARYDRATIEPLFPLVGHNVRITATVVESRVSGHIGDQYRGIKPSRPEVGEVIDLGVGKLFFREESWSATGLAIGIEPSDGRKTDWFDPKKLYRLHDQTVTITITATEEESDFVPEYESNVDDTATWVIQDGIGQYKGKHFEVWKS